MEAPMEALKASELDQGMNYLIADGVVYGAMKALNAGILFTQEWHRGDPDYELRYRTATANPRTLFRARS